LGSLDRLHARNFNRSYMRDYLKLPADSKAVNSLNGAFPPENFFCFVGILLLSISIRFDAKLDQRRLRFWPKNAC
jgi:hypothetical protein